MTAPVDLDALERLHAANSGLSPDHIRALIAELRAARYKLIEISCTVHAGSISDQAARLAVQKIVDGTP